MHTCVYTLHLMACMYVCMCIQDEKIFFLREGRIFRHLCPGLHHCDRPTHIVACETVCMYACMVMRMCRYNVCMNVCLYACIYVCLCVCVYVYILEWLRIR